jgi:phage terminase small subunit
MTTRKKPQKRVGAEPSTAVAILGSVEISATTERTPAVAPTLQELEIVLTPIEEKFARHYVLCSNATKAFIEATNYIGQRASARVMAWELSNRPHVLKRVREYESAAAAAVVMDYAAILDHDRQIVEGHKHADEITQHIWQCCRYCHGVEHKYQWIDYAEYLAALSAAGDKNEERKARKLGEQPLPDDLGGYGFMPSNDPNLLCPQCEGRGHAVTVIADTTKLEGPARVIVKGVKVTSSGTEVIFHDIDKAKERLLRAAGMFKDDAASVARGAAAGAAAGATAAIAAAKAAESMTVDQAQRLYLELA